MMIGTHQVEKNRRRKDAQTRRGGKAVRSDRLPPALGEGGRQGMRLGRGGRHADCMLFPWVWACCAPSEREGFQQDFRFVFEKDVLERRQIAPGL